MSSRVVPTVATTVAAAFGMTFMCELAVLADDPMIASHGSGMISY